jgi:hypothetical protein
LASLRASLKLHHFPNNYPAWKDVPNPQHGLMLLPFPTAGILRLTSRFPEAFSMKISNSFAAARSLPLHRLAMRGLAVAILVAAAVTGAPAQSLDGALRSQGLPVLVEIEGSVPGFTKDELSTYLCQQLTASHITGWRFLPTSMAGTGGDQPSNRIVWHFKPLPYAGGGTRYIGPAMSKAKELFGVGRAVSIDAKIFLNDQFEATTFDEATVKGGPNDPGLAAAIQKVMKSVVSNAFLTESRDRTKPSART